LRRLDKERWGIKPTLPGVGVEQSHAAWQLRRLAGKAVLAGIFDPVPLPYRNAIPPREMPGSATVSMLNFKLNAQQRRTS
jgi:hypothetical protein